MSRSAAVRALWLVVAGLLLAGGAGGDASAAALTVDIRPPALSSRVEPVAQRSCGLRLDGAGPDARCSRYKAACLRYGNAEARCQERLEACTRCAVGFQDCEKKVGRIMGLLTTCEKCVATFKRCTREYDRRLPAKQP